MSNLKRLAFVLAAGAALGGCGIFNGSKNATPTVGQRVPILVAENSIAADPDLAGIDVLLPPAAANAAWAQPGGNASKSMGHLALATAPSRLWHTGIAGGGKRARLASAPIVADGKLYVVDIDGRVNAFDAENGAELWTRPTSENRENSNALFGGGVAYESGKLYATNGLGDVVALDAASGDQLWKVRPGGPLRGAPTIAYGHVYVVTQDNQFFTLNQNDGSVVWTSAGAVETQGVFGVAAPAAAQSTVVAGFSSGELNAYRYENGRQLWTDVLSRTSMSTSVSSLSDIDADPVIDQGRVYAVGQGGRMVALDLASGRRLWEENFASISTPWVVGEWVFVVTEQAKLICIQRGTGRIRWISQLRRWRDEEDQKGMINWVGPVLAGGKLWLANSRGQVIAASPSDGSFQPVAEVDGDVSLPLVVANNTLYILDDSGKLTAFR
ncbi:PQQ-like beta-propeller repeat protein [Stakelama tenebrarum]|uniref:PQQ-binding-like beta-propeller repeat protein n=1 Tax=Stakelama tenebrarum TaxID=2711215 RepID=A0A6G6Y8H1_9SPHN|nr:PQQ-like beta-propeller repeat protein [Sphingosinithalassobacter tenebrarum]QIG81225.1 PQQ-binding-like beta-propeller repeat protein [Sphingosinithalassobacter tenebrarum]